MLNPCHEVTKLLHYGNKHSRLFNKENVLFRNFKLFLLKHIKKVLKKYSLNKLEEYRYYYCYLTW